MFTKRVLLNLLISAIAVSGVTCPATGCASTDAQLKLCIETLEAAAELRSDMDQGIEVLNEALARVGDSEPIPVGVIATINRRFRSLDRRIDAMDGGE